MIYNVNGELTEEEDATVSVRDRGFRYGDAAFETLRAYGGRVFRWRSHATRLDATCRSIGLEHGLDDGDLRTRICETLHANELEDAYIRLSVTRGSQAGGLDPRPIQDPTVVVVVKPLPRGGTRGGDVWERPAELETVEVQRTPSEAIPASAKTHNYLNGILARRELSDGADEAMMCDGNGFVAEGATSNLFFVSDGTLHTPSLDNPVLPGITRETILDLAESEGIPVESDAYDPSYFYHADEIFCTNTTWEIRPVVRVDDRKFDAPGQITSTLTTAMNELIEDEYYRR